ncbi:protein YgfX [Alkanindiges sp. WGS2144]|uniref:protein YgfX n=1 Tax=Alkanindiges sp. WGS2144 TaxID=3366808 RepID=UPI0037512B62
MLVDARIHPGVLQYLFHGIGIIVVLVLILQSGLGLLLNIGLALAFLGLDYIYLKQKHQQRINQFWQRDDSVWCWQVQGSSQRQTGQLLQIRRTSLWVSLQLGHGHKKYHLLFWRDQVEPEQWRRLTVLAFLKNSQQNLLN